MNRSARQFLLERLEDERSKRVVFVSPCLLNEHTRYLGGAFPSGDLHELADGFQREGMGISQMSYPEQRTCCGVLKRTHLLIYGSKDMLLHLHPSSRGTHDGGAEEPLGEAQRRFPQEELSGNVGT